MVQLKGSLFWCVMAGEAEGWIARVRTRNLESQMEMHRFDAVFNRELL